MRRGVVLLSVLVLGFASAEGVENVRPVTPDDRAEALVADQGPLTVGEDVFESYESPHPYAGSSTSEAQLVWSDTLYFPGASYIAPHFSRFELAQGDYVLVRSPEGTRRWRYEEYGKGDLGRMEGFWGVNIPGETALVELWSVNPRGAFGYTIDRYARGFSADEMGGGDEQEALCGPDDSLWAPCYEFSEPEVYDRARAVARLLITGQFACTGWLVGSEGHLMTNQHCIENASDAANTDFEFMAEGADCSTNCASSFGCPGTIVAVDSTLVQSSVDWDYTLVDLPVNPTATYGYLQLRPSGAVVDERMYIPQHPAGWGKKIAVVSTHSNDQSGYCEVYSLDEPGCSGRPGPDVGYFADTQGGSSGSPVLGYSDHRVISLHHCANCPNRGLPIDVVIADLGSNVPPGAVCVSFAGPSNVAAAPDTPTQTINVSWTAVPEAATYDVYRSVGACPQTEPELVASGIAGTIFADFGLSGQVTYSYSVVAVDGDGCESDPSPCAEATGDWTCTLPPFFAGATEVANPGLSTCTLEVRWDMATAACDGPVSYNVYRSKSPGFVPDSTNRIASGVTGSTYTDDWVLVSDTIYHYVVRAVDVGNGSEEANSVERSSWPTGPVSTDNWFDDAGDTGTAQLVLDAPWVIRYGAGVGASRGYRTDPYGNNTCAALTTPEFTVAPDAELSFYSKYEIEAGKDKGEVQISVDGGANWERVPMSYPGSSTDGGDACGLPADETYFTGQGLVWAEFTASLSPWAQLDAQVRWVFSTDGQGTAGGWWIDDVTAEYVTSVSTCSTAGDPPLFADGFESGDTSAWSSMTTP